MESYLYGNILSKRTTFHISNRYHQYVDISMTANGHVFHHGQLQESQVPTWIQKVSILHGQSSILVNRLKGYEETSQEKSKPSLKILYAISYYWVPFKSLENLLNT